MTDVAEARDRRWIALAGFAVLGLLATLFLIRTADSKAHVELSGEVALDEAN